MTLKDVKEKLLGIQPAAFEPDWYLEPWFNPAVCEYYVANAVEVIPTSIRWGQGKPFCCHLNSLAYSAAHPGAIPYFGMQYLEWAAVAFPASESLGEEVAASWEVHSWVVEEDGSIVDSGQYVPAATRYVGVPWSWELHDLITADSQSRLRLPLSRPGAAK